MIGESGMIHSNQSSGRRELEPGGAEVPDALVMQQGAADVLAVEPEAAAQGCAILDRLRGALAESRRTAWRGPLVSTSANPAGAPPARSPLQVRRYFGDRLELVLAGALGASRRPTSIRDGRSGRLLRA